LRSETFEEVDGTSYVVRNLQLRTLIFYWSSEKWRKDYQKYIVLVMNRTGGGWKEKICM
jgi:hypothetical protein